MTLDMWREVPQSVPTSRENSEVRVVLLHGAGHKAFVAGADISQFSESRTSTNSSAYTEATADAYGQSRTVPCPQLLRSRAFALAGALPWPFAPMCGWLLTIPALDSLPPSSGSAIHRTASTMS